MLTKERESVSMHESEPDCPVVSIIIPTYNMACTVSAAVETALAQSFKNIEVIVCDNASTDNTQEVIQQFDDIRLRVLRNSANIGAVGNFNLGISVARGMWVKFVEADDYIKSNCVEMMLRAAEGDPRIGIVSTGREIVDSDGHKCGEHLKLSENVSGRAVKMRLRRRGNEIGTPTDVMVRREVLLRAGGFDPDFGSYLNDWDLWLRCLDDCDVAFVREALVVVRRHEGQIGSRAAQTNQDIDANLLMWKKRWPGAGSLSGEGWVKVSFAMIATECFLWRGGVRLFRRTRRRAVGPLDFISRLYRQLGMKYFAVGCLYSVVHSPIYAWWLIKSRILN